MAFAVLAAQGRVTNRVHAADATKDQVYVHVNGQLLTEDNPGTQNTVTYGYNNARLRNSLSLQQPSLSWANITPTSHWGRVSIFYNWVSNLEFQMEGRALRVPG